MNDIGKIAGCCVLATIAALFLALAITVRGCYLPYVWHTQRVEAEGVRLRMSHLEGVQCRNAAMLCLVNDGDAVVRWELNYQDTTPLRPSDSRWVYVGDRCHLPLTILDAEGKSVLWKGIVPDDFSEVRTTKTDRESPWQTGNAVEKEAE